MNKILRFTFVAAFALISSLSFAQTETTIDLSAQNYTNAAVVTTVQSSDKGVTLTFDKGTGRNAPAYYTTGTAVRIYGGAYVKVSANGTITKAVFTWGSGNKVDQPEASATDKGTYDATTSTWTGSATDFTLTRPSGSGHWRLQKVVVTYTPSGVTPTPTLNAPTITGTTSFSESTQVTITADEGATIYYTTDGQDPDDREGTEYTAPFTITETTTVKAIAYKGELESDIASATFTKVAAGQHAGTEADPYTPTEANAAASALASGAKSDNTVYVKGVVSKIDQVDTNRYGNARFYISADGTTTSEQFYCYDCFNLKGAKFTVATQISVGDNVVVSGNLQNFNGTYELARGGQIVSTDHKDKPIETENAADIAAFNALAVNTPAVLTLKDAKVLYSWTSDKGNNSTYISDASGALCLRNTGLDLTAGQVLNGTVNLTRTDYNGTVQAEKNDNTSKTTFTAVDGDAPVAKVITPAEASANVSNLVQFTNVNITEDNGKFYIVNGDDKVQVYNGFHIEGYTVAAAEGVDVKGIIVKYNNTYEIYPVNAPVTTGISEIKADKVAVNANAPLYNVAGQRVDKSFKGVVIQNGHKFLNK